MAASNETLIGKLNDLIELDFDAIEAYQAAIERLEDPQYKKQLGEFLGDHQRHTRDLTALVTQLGGQPSRGPDFKRYLTKGKVVIADLVGQDRAILLAMRANEEVTNKRYELALSVNTDMPVDARTLLEANLGDERRHRDWIEQQVKEETQKKEESHA